ncbi:MULTISPECIES: type I phosphomannose isomerase catalytic subunit [Psychrilyobacter]|uniref:Phosphohexomutase n=1 Tax=Psychrilyobacter piezotolerans TaxID=2293438 RepID=A0ABX9KIH2_9FUSO|nr:MULTISPECIES: type I phosphomannose isomerase catalytic subunit [Psychrilyobacter]MCS5420615.1 class I mannose-6-phosphate isomerase [Psychrilyobacter sp. S5]NDI77366.1 class I mannose-6-phosphate isomerase [Psychrilyobacter piezotolerans]RDE63671.1 class I mannose-6-phosphate isomerase [Psychrilyobacter sp. S5]REI42015.1 class I mannose-6-phosphate isomerase [Psychrilyobacter piezotolerans]
MERLYPFKFKKVFKEKVWGGRGFEKSFEMTLPTEDSYGESWEVSSRKNEMSVIENGRLEGKTLEELFSDYKGNFVGEKVYHKYGGKFPLLIKYLDINDRLSVQVHPNDEYALRVEGEFGKSESWYIMEASSDAKLIMGFKEGMTKKLFMEKTKNKNFNDLFNIISIKKGDFINVTPGLVHASLEGSILICEVQQNSDITYRIYDFDRLIDGELRELHLDKAMEVIDYETIPQINTDQNRKNVEVNGGTKQEIIRGKYFNIDKFLLEKKFEDTNRDSFMIYSILEGEGNLNCDGVAYSIKKGETWYIPPKLNIEIEGELEILKTFM